MSATHSEVVVFITVFYSMRNGWVPGPGTSHLYATRVCGEFRIFPPLFPPSVIAESKHSAED